MEKKETAAIMALMRMSYPRFYPTTQSNEEVEQVLDLWHDFFKDDDVEVVKMAVANLIKSLEYPPTIADVKKEMEKLVGAATNESQAVEEWNAIRQAIKSSIYYSVENFNKLPEIAKKFVGSPTQLRDWAMTEDFNDGVIRGQFFKQYDTLKEREKIKAELNPQLAGYIKKLTEKTQLIGGSNVIDYESSK